MSVEEDMERIKKLIEQKLYCWEVRVAKWKSKAGEGFVLTLLCDRVPDIKEEGIIEYIIKTIKNFYGYEISRVRPYYGGYVKRWGIKVGFRRKRRGGFSR